jgi:hypothetical protein
MKLLLGIILFWSFSINTSAQNYICKSLFNAFEQKDLVSFRKQYELNLKYDKCTTAIIDTIAFKIKNKGFKQFELEFLCIVSECSDGYASEYVSTSMQNIYEKNFDEFMYKAFLFDKKKAFEYNEIMNIILESDLFIDFKLIESTKKLAERVRKTNSDYYNYLIILIRKLNI